ncbi:hypothetical protein G5C51_25945 [Streptomyces sp. A7024]|uniref:Transferase n=1 Tax=Streptomyces coryli TaxID=1128680 RepID=A0A6G4U5G4_9ACTN|nr:hypothetical protein [Streptomyces coryli]NGN67333.1 hypothetical protein [Streptomyces coryli]
MTAVERPAADIVADRSGALCFIVRSAPTGAALLLRRRGGTAPEDELRLPLDGNGADGPHAILRGDLPLAEGRWNVHLEPPEGKPVRLAPGLNDLRALVDRAADFRAGGTAPVRARIPYKTVESNLSLVSWQRTPHAEAADLHVTGATLRIGGLLYGAGLTPSATLEARRRTDGDVLWEPMAPVTVEGPRFEAGLPYGALAEAARRLTGPQIWDLALRPAPDAAPVRIARILDDVPLKKQIFTYPATEFGGGTARPYYTKSNDLAVRIEG